MRISTKSKLKKFGRHFELAKQKFNFSSRDPSNYTRAPHARMAQFWLKIAHLSFSIATTPLLKMILSYGLRPRLWLLFKLNPGIGQYKLPSLFKFRHMDKKGKSPGNKVVFPRGGGRGGANIQLRKIKNFSRASFWPRLLKKRRGPGDKLVHVTILDQCEMRYVRVTYVRTVLLIVHRFLLVLRALAQISGIFLLE